MNLSQNVLLCEYSPMRKFHPYAAAAAQQGKKIYHLNLGQPDIKTPEAFFAAVRNFQQDVLAYCPSGPAGDDRSGAAVLLQAGRVL